MTTDHTAPTGTTGSSTVSTSAAPPPDRTAPSSSGAAAPGATATASKGGATTLIADTEGLRSRWDQVQTGFVDEPRDAVRQADELVSEAIDELTRSLAGERHRLEERWSTGDDASTEDLRLALQRYRDFFDRLLTR
ncbi:MAG: hypothetical protein S0880_22485 [Actinomycetota bacterium]|nr:hypothetical protein [Actinomycetota bacterium]